MTATLAAVLLAAAAGVSQEFQTSYAEVGAERHYKVDFLSTPDGVAVEVGGMDFLPDGRLAVSTRRGQVWLVENPLADDPGKARFALFAEGLHEGLGLKVVGGVIHVLQRAELSRLFDTDGDQRCDRIEVVANDWGVSGNYHEFAYGLPADTQGHFYLSLNVGFFEPYWFHGQSLAPYRGWVLRVSPEGTVTPWASGFRSPNGIGVNDAGDLFVTDNQGDWVAVCPLFHVRKGGFYGHPASLDWTQHYRENDLRASFHEPPRTPRTPAAVYLPYGLSRSTGNFAPDTSGGKFGPFGKQLFAAEVTNGLIARVQLEQVRGEYQGAAFLFRKDVGAANRVLFAPDGTLLVGCTSRGWGGAGAGHGISRVRYTGVLPFEMQSVHLLQDGFAVTFTKPVAKLEAAQVALDQYAYPYWWKYGAPEIDHHKPNVIAVELSADRCKATIRAADLRQGYVARLVLQDTKSDDDTPLVHNRVDYTINQLPSGPFGTTQVVRVVPTPRTEQQDAEGWVTLTDDNVMDLWQGEGWTLGHDPRLTEEGKLRVRKGGNVIVNEKAGAAALVCRAKGRDCDVDFEFLLPRGGVASALFPGRAGILLADSKGSKEVSADTCGAVALSAGGGERRAPCAVADQGAGNWNRLEARYRSLPAKFEWVRLNGKTVQENVALAEPPAADVGARGLLAFETASQLAIRNVRVKALPPAEQEAGWVTIFNGKDLEGWKRGGKAKWTVRDGVIEGSGAMGHLFSPRGDYQDLELRARCRINTGGNSGMYVRAAFSESWPNGYEAQVNRSHRDPIKSGSLYGLVALKTRLIPHDDCWFTQHVICRNEPDGTRLRTLINGIEVVDFLDRERRHGRGHVAFQQHHLGSVVQYTDVQVRTH